jgi:hypothetical protein
MGVWALWAEIGAVIDLRRPEVQDMLGLVGHDWLFERTVCRTIAAALRDQGACDALLVPSAGLHDSVDRANLVVLGNANRPGVELSGVRIAFTLTGAHPRGPRTPGD